MPKITFLHTRVVQDQHVGTPLQTRYEAGQTYELPTASCERWIRRGLAEAVTEAPVPVPVTPNEARGMAGLKPLSGLNPQGAGQAPTRSGGPADDPPAATVEIPENWRTLTYFALRSLAAKLTPHPVNDKATAVAAIEAELARREASQGPQETEPAGDA